MTDKDLWIIWSNTGGELDRVFIPEGENATDALHEMVGDIDMHPGDTIRVVEATP